MTYVPVGMVWGDMVVSLRGEVMAPTQVMVGLRFLCYALFPFIPSLTRDSAIGGVYDIKVSKVHKRSNYTSE